MYHASLKIHLKPMKKHGQNYWEQSRWMELQREWLVFEVEIEIEIEIDLDLESDQQPWRCKLHKSVRRDWSGGA